MNGNSPFDASIPPTIFVSISDVSLGAPGVKI